MASFHTRLFQSSITANRLSQLSLRQAWDGDQ